MAINMAICSPWNVAVITCDRDSWQKRPCLLLLWYLRNLRRTLAQRFPLTAAASAKWLLHVSLSSAQRILEAAAVYRADSVLPPLTARHFNWTASFGRQAARRVHRFLKLSRYQGRGQNHQNFHSACTRISRQSSIDLPWTGTAYKTLEPNCFPAFGQEK